MVCHSVLSYLICKDVQDMQTSGYHCLCQRIRRNCWQSMITHFPKHSKHEGILFVVCIAIFLGITISHYQHLRKGLPCNPCEACLISQYSNLQATLLMGSRRTLLMIWFGKTNLDLHDSLAAALAQLAVFRVVFLRLAVASCAGGANLLPVCDQDCINKNSARTYLKQMNVSTLLPLRCICRTQVNHEWFQNMLYIYIYI